MATSTPSSSSATAAAVSPSSSCKKEKANHTRLCRLLVDIGRQVLQVVFDRICPPSTLNAVLCSGAVTSADFDITLLFLSLRNICKLKAPGTGWDKPPLETDLSNEADLVRIKRCRNELCAHIVNAAIPDNEFQTLWNDIEAALLRLGIASKYRVQIDRLKHGNLDADCEDSFKVLLSKSWEEGEEKTLDAIRELHDALTNQRMISINGTIKMLTAAGLVVTWAAGSGYFLHRYRNDPEEVIRLVNEAIIPALHATVACVRDILPGSFKILVDIQSLEALDAIWKRYNEGDMKKNLEKVIVTDDLRCLAPEDVVKVDISLNISEDNYRHTCHYLLQPVLRNYWKACKTPSSTSEEISAITKQVKHIGIFVTAAYEYKSEWILFKPGKIEWKVLKELLIKATNLPVIRENRITLEMSDPIDDIARALVKTSADLNLEDSQGETLLIYSTKMGADKAVEILLNAGADVNLTDERGRAPLMYAVENGSLEVAEILMKAGADADLADVTGKISLFHAAQAGTTRIAQYLIEAGAEVNVTDTRGKAPLMYAVENGSLEVVDILIKAGAEANWTDVTGKTSLTYAAQAGKTPVAQSLIKAGAVVNVTDARKKTPLMYAVETGNPEVVDILIKAGADVNMTDVTGKTSLIYAAEAGKTRIAQSLIEAGAEEKQKDRKPH